MKLSVKTLSPVHFAASPFPMTTLDFAFVNNTCYVLSEQGLLDALREKGIAEEFVEWLQQEQTRPKASERREPRQEREPERWQLGLARQERRPRSRPKPEEPQSPHPEITSFLRRHGMLSPAVLEPFTRYTVRCRVAPRGEVRALPRTSRGAPYLPATAIKGALRIGVAYSLLKAMPERHRRRILDDFVAGELERYHRDDRSRQGPGWFQERVRRNFAGRVDQELLQSFRLTPEGSRSGPNTDVFRALRLADSRPVEPGAVAICDVRVFSAHSKTSPKRWTIYTECVWTGTTFSLDLSVDERLLAAFEQANTGTRYGLPFATVADMVRRPLEAAATLTADLHAAEHAFFSNELEMPGAMDLRGETPNLRLGWGTTMFGTSLSLLLPDRLRRALRNSLFCESGDTYAPKSRKLVQVGSNTFSLGWARAEVAAD